MVHISSGTLLGHEEARLLPFAAMWMDLEMVMLMGKPDRERQIP